MKQRLAADGDVERNIWVRFGTTSVVLLVLDGWNAKQVPLNTRVEIFELDSSLQ